MEKLFRKPSKDRLVEAALAGLVFLFNILLYSKVVSFYFYSDDFHHLLVNSRTPRFISALAFPAQVESNVNLYRPTTNWFFGLNYRLFGLNPLPYHLEMLVFVALTAAFLYLFMRRYEVGRLAAFSAAIFFSVLPSHTDPASWLANVCDTLMVLFGLVGLVAVSAYMASARKAYLLSGLALLSLALLSKEPGIAFLLPALAVVFFAGKGRGRAVSGAIFALPFLAYGITRFFYGRYVASYHYGTYYKLPGQGDFAGAAFREKMAQFASSLFFLPSESQALRYGFFYGTLFFVLAAGLLVFAFSRFGKAFQLYLLGAALFLGSLAASISVPVVVDRYLYLPSLGLTMVAAAFLSSLGRLGWAKAFFWAGLLGLAAVSVAYLPLTRARLDLVGKASQASRALVSGIGGIPGNAPVVLYDVPFAYDGRLLGHWEYDQPVITEANHPQMAQELFYQGQRKVFVGSFSHVDEYSPGRYEMVPFVFRPLPAGIGNPRSYGFDGSQLVLK